MSGVSRKRSPPIIIPSNVYGSTHVSIDQYLELLDLVHEMAHRLDKIEESLLDNFSVMDHCLGESLHSEGSHESLPLDDNDFEISTDSSGDEEELSIVDLTTEDYDPSRYYV